MAGAKLLNPLDTNPDADPEGATLGEMDPAVLMRQFLDMKRQLDEIGLRLLGLPGSSQVAISPAVTMANASLERAQMDQEYADTKAYLLAQPRVRVRIALESNDKTALAQAREKGQDKLWPVWPCRINGVNFWIRKGEPVEVPWPIAELIEAEDAETGLVSRHSLNTIPAGQDRPGFWVDGDSPFSG